MCASSGSNGQKQKSSEMRYSEWRVVWLLITAPKDMQWPRSLVPRAPLEASTTPRWSPRPAAEFAEQWQALCSCKTKPRGATLQSFCVALVCCLLTTYFFEQTHGTSFGECHGPRTISVHEPLTADSCTLLICLPIALHNSGELSIAHYPKIKTL